MPKKPAVYAVMHSIAMITKSLSLHMHLWNALNAPVRNLMKTGSNCLFITSRKVVVSAQCTCTLCTVNMWPKPCTYSCWIYRKSRFQHALMTSYIWLAVATCALLSMHKTH